MTLNQKLINVLVFTTGAAIGSLVTWRVMKSRCEQYVQDEMDKFVEDWKERGHHQNVPSEDKWDEFENDGDDEEVLEYHQLAKKYGGEGVEEVGFSYVNGPVVITPDEFGDGNYVHFIYINWNMCKCLYCICME